MALVYITLAGTMQGYAWGGFDAETEFSTDFLLGGDGPWCKPWDGIREALLEVTSWGDVQGGMGELTFAEITFHYAGASKRSGEGSRRAITRELKPTRNTKDFYV
jgi:hypothetical protein